MLGNTRIALSSQNGAPMERVLVASGSEALQRSVSEHFNGEGLETLCFCRGVELLESSRLARIRLVAIHDDSCNDELLQLCKKLRLRCVRAPIALLSSTTVDPHLQGRAVDHGADRIITVPPLERFFVHARSLILHARGAFAERVCAGPFCVDYRLAGATVGNTHIDLTLGQTRLLWYLCRHVNSVCTLEELITDVVGSHPNDAAKKAVVQQVRRLRERLGAFGQYIQTRPGFGYIIFA